MNKVKFNITRKDGKNYSGEGILFTNELKIWDIFTYQSQIF